MVHAQVLKSYIHFALIYKAHYMFLILKIKNLINEGGDTTTLFKLAVGTKTLALNLRVLFCLCVVRKGTAHVGTKLLNMVHQAQNYFRDKFVGIPQHQKVYIVYVPHKRNIISSYNVVFMRVFLVLWRTRHNHILKQCL